MTKSQQELAIEKVTGPCLIEAGAGTGKSHTMVEKIAYLVNNDICKAKDILCLTFSNEATNHLREEVEKKLRNGADVEVRTFHGFCADILREFGHLIKIDPGFEILLPDDSVVLVHKELGIKPYYADLYLRTISTAKDFGIKLEQIEEYAEKLKEQFKGIKDLDAHAEKVDLELKTLHLSKQPKGKKKELTAFIKHYKTYVLFRDFVDAWKKYEQLKHKNSYQDYADLNYNVLQLINRFDLNEIRRRYKYVVVDEFQDTNKMQFELIEYIAIEHKNITVVGDLNQSIYGFRGAYRECFRHFKETYKVNEKTDIFKLDKSYRSPDTVLRVAHKLIKNNYENEKDCFLIKNAEGRDGKKVKLFQMKNGDEEARKVAELVEEEIEKGTNMQDICVLFRTHKQGKQIRQAVESKNIPIVSAGKIDLLQKPEIKTVVAYLSLLNNLMERTGTGEQAWWSLFHYHNSLLPEDAIKIGRFLKVKRDEEISIDMALLNHLPKLDLSEHGKKIIERLVLKLKEMMNSANKPLPDLVMDVYEIAGLNRAFSHTRSTKNVEAMMHLKQFYEITENYYRLHGKDLPSFIDYLEVMDDLDVVIDASKIQEVNAVRLMTMHSVKGLQFKTVIVTNLAEGRFPVERTRNEPLIPKELLPDLKRYLDSLGDLDEDAKIEAIKDYEAITLIIEERRLCYVAFTRAKENLILTFARSYNDKEDSTSASMFLREVEYEKNDDIQLKADDDEKCTIFAPCSKYEQFKSSLKEQFIGSLDSDDFESLFSRLATYYSVREGEVIDLDSFKLKVDKKELEKHVAMHKGKCSGLKFDAKNFTFSPSAVLAYEDCPKKYELSNIYHMPERGDFGWSGASTGSFIHEVLKEGVENGFKSKKEFVEMASKLALLSEWKGVDLKDVNHLIDVFWARHAGRYNSKSIVEEWVEAKIGGFTFKGKFDRIDFVSSNEVEIIDYKTDKQPVKPKKRAWQLGFYAIGIKEKFKFVPVKMTLEMLRQDKPFETAVDSNGNFKAGASGDYKDVSLERVKKELIECAKNIVHDYENEFKPTTEDGPCEWCGYKFYCPKWDG